MIYFWVIFVCFILDILLEIMRKKMYTASIEWIKYPRFRLTMRMEKFLYTIEYIAKKIPCLLFDSSIYLGMLQREYIDVRDEKERVIILCEIIGEYIKCFIGIRIAYIICAVIAVSRWFGIGQLKKKFYFMWEKILEINCIKILAEIVKFVNANMNFIIVLFFLLITIYVLYIKKKLERYKIEKMWQGGRAERETDIAEAQAQIKKELREVLEIINENQSLIKLVLRGGNYGRLNQLKAYREIIEKIKNNLKIINDNAGKKLYLEYNKGIWNQLEKFSFTNHDTWTLNFIEIMKCDKDNILNMTKMCSDEACKRAYLLNAWICGIYSMSGLGRCLRYMDNRYIKFCKLQLKVESASFLKKEIQESK